MLAHHPHGHRRSFLMPVLALLLPSSPLVRRHGKATGVGGPPRIQLHVTTAAGCPEGRPAFIFLALLPSRAAGRASPGAPPGQKFHPRHLLRSAPGVRAQHASGLHRSWFVSPCPRSPPPPNHWSGRPPASRLGRVALLVIIRLAAGRVSRRSTAQAQTLGPTSGDAHAPLRRMRGWTHAQPAALAQSAGGAIDGRNGVNCRSGLSATASFWGRQAVPLRVLHLPSDQRPGLEPIITAGAWALFAVSWFLQPMVLASSVEQERWSGEQGYSRCW